MLSHIAVLQHHNLQHKQTCKICTILSINHTSSTSRDQSIINLKRLQLNTGTPTVLSPLNYW